MHRNLPGAPYDHGLGNRHCSAVIDAAYPSLNRRSDLSNLLLALAHF